MARNSRPTDGRRPKRRRVALKRHQKAERERRRLTKGIRGAKRMCRRKVRYSSEAAALLVATSTERKRGVELRTYRCPICGGWHLTSHTRGR